MSTVRFLSSLVCLVFVPLLLSQETALAQSDVSVERGLYVSIVGGCHDCHTLGYNESGGVIDPNLALKGTTVGFQGPWGTTYAANLRLRAADLSEDGFLGYAKTLKTYPPMPWYNVRKMTDSDLRSLYRYIRSLGDPGDGTPPFVPPGNRVSTPYIVLAPPQPPPACTRDLDCGVGEICGTAEPRQCVKR